MTAKILLVDDDTTFCLMLKTWLTKRGFSVEEAFSCKEAVGKLKKSAYDVVLTDLRLPDEDGLQVLQEAKKMLPGVQVILMTGYADISTAVQAMKLGAFDYVAKPVIPDEILKKIQEAVEHKDLPAEKKHAKKAEGLTYIKGTSRDSDKLYEYIRLVAPTMMTVLITGESGSGKEYIARLIHNQSKRQDAPFVAVDCGAIPKDLAASEFFGHVKGAFTGAVSDKTGYFVQANGGTIFLDEIDKVAARSDRSGGQDVSREGVQRDILPIVEGSNVNTKFGVVDTTHILFIAAGAFSISKPSDLIPELQGRFPLRVELDSLHAEDFRRILLEPRNALIRQYSELLATEDVTLSFTDEAIDRMSFLAAEVNSRMENIGARRLHTIMEMLLEEISFNAPDLAGQHIEITREYVDERLKDIVQDQDLSRYIL